MDRLQPKKIKKTLTNKRQNNEDKKLEDLPHDAQKDGILSNTRTYVK